MRTLVIAVLVASSTIALGQGTNKDPILQKALGVCDQQAEDALKQIDKSAPINPTNLLSPFLMYNDAVQRHQQSQQRPLQIEQVHQWQQQCRAAAENVAMERAAVAHRQSQDLKLGFRPLSFETFALDGTVLAKQAAKVSMSGVYFADGDMEYLFASEQSVYAARTYTGVGRNELKIPLVTSAAAREFRSYLLRCRTGPASAQVGCRANITGNVTMCTFSNLAGLRREAPCISVSGGIAGTR